MCWDFKPLRFEDLPQFQEWVHQDHVYEWWYEDALDLDQLTEVYRDDIEGRGTTYSYIVHRNGEPFGYIQWYCIGDEPDWAPPSVRIDEHDAAVDLFVGDPEGVGRGLGVEMVRTFLRDVLFHLSDANYCWIDPDEANTRARRAYEKAGFEPVAIVDRVVEGRRERVCIMRISRD